MSVHATWNNDTRTYYAELERRKNEIPNIPDNTLYVVPCYDEYGTRIIFKNKNGLVIHNNGEISKSLENDVELRKENPIFTNNHWSHDKSPQELYYTRGNITTKEYNYLGKDIIFDFSKFNEETKKYISHLRKSWFRELPIYILFFILRCGDTKSPL